MASPEVCRALPTMTWSISSAPKPLRVSASFAAKTPRSIALMSEKCPLYSAIGVRAPSTMKMSFTRGYSFALGANVLTGKDIRMKNLETTAAFFVLHSSFELLHSAFCLHRKNRDSKEFGNAHPYAPLDPEL